MKKSYYFSHDFDASSDPKLSYIIGKYGASGYGLWWRIVEMLHATDQHRLPFKNYLLESIANSLKLEVDFVNTFITECIEEVDLMLSDGTHFWSERVLENMGKMDEIREKKSLAGKLSAQKRQQNSTGVEHVLAGVEHNPTKEKKVKEIKEDMKAPTLTDFENYFKENGYDRDVAKNAFEYYACANWTDSRGNKVKNWKQKLRAVWFKPEHKLRPHVSSFAMPVN